MTKNTYVRTTITLFGLVFYALYVLKNFDQIPSLNLSLNFLVVLLLSVILVSIGAVLVGTVWYVLLKDAGQEVSFIKTQEIYAVAQFCKYLPGNVGHYIGRAYLAKQQGIPVAVTLSNIFIEVVWGACIATCLSLLAFIFYLDVASLKLPFELNGIKLALIFLSLLLLPWVVISSLNIFAPEWSKKLSGTYKPIVVPSITSALAVSLLFAGCFLIMGCVLKLHTQAIFISDDGGIIEFMCLFSLAWLVGYILPGAPGGVGVRELMMALLLTPVTGAGIAVGLGVTLRIVTTVSDLLVFILGMYGSKLMVKQ